MTTDNKEIKDDNATHLDGLRFKQEHPDFYQPVTIGSIFRRDFAISETPPTVEDLMAHMELADVAEDLLESLCIRIKALSEKFNVMSWTASEVEYVRAEMDDIAKRHSDMFDALAIANQSRLMFVAQTLETNEDLYIRPYEV